MSIRIFHTGDLHLGAEYKSFQNRSLDLKQESLSALEKMINYVTDPYNDIQVMLIAGDLFDSHRPDLPLVEKVKELLRKVIVKNIKLYILPGNHDSYSYKNSIFRSEEFPGQLITSKEFSLVEETSFNGEKLFVYSGIFDIMKPNKRILKDFKIIDQPGAHLGILHGTLEMREISIPDRELPFSYEEFAESGLNYLALGHFHRHFEKQVNKQHRLAYCGSIIPRKIDEYNQKYALVTEIKQNNTVEIEPLPFSKIRSEKMIINTVKESVEDLRSLFQLIKKHKDPNLILDLFLEGTANFNIEAGQLEKIFNDDFFHIRINNQIKYIESSLIKQLQGEETIRGLYFKKLAEHSVISSETQKKVLDKALNLGLREFTARQQEQDTEFALLKEEQKK